MTKLKTIGTQEYTDYMVKEAIRNPIGFTPIPGWIWSSDVDNLKIIAWAIQTEWSYKDNDQKIDALGYAAKLDNVISKPVVTKLTAIIFDEANVTEEDARIMSAGITTVRLNEATIENDFPLSDAGVFFLEAATITLVCSGLVAFAASTYFFPEE